MKICVIGSNGQLGSDICKIFKNHEIISLTHFDIEISDENKCLDIIKTIKSNVIINTAAFHNVPKCEEDKESAMKVNIQGVSNLAKASEIVKAQFVHYSTDYVFDGFKTTPYIETDTPNPLNFYGITKLAGEIAIKNYCNNYKIIRIGGIYGKIPCRAKNNTNFIVNMLNQKNKKEINVINDEFVSPTNTIDIANKTNELINHSDSGIFHMSNSGHCTWYEFAISIFDFARITIKINPSLSIDSYIKRPKWSIMENKRLSELSIKPMRHWKEALRSYFE
jgi:dTDP-4-dehydrorhamnose reductase